MKKLLSLCVALFLLTGCMEARELKERCIIEAVGIDKEGGEYSLVFQQYQASADNKSGSTGKSRPVKTAGRSISEAIDKVTHYNGNEVFLGNSTYIVLGSDMAKEGILEELQYFNGEGEISPSTFLVVTDGSASELISAQAETQTQTSSTIRDILEQGQKNGLVGKPTMMNVLKNLNGDCASPYLPVISKIEEGGKESESQSSQQNQSEKSDEGEKQETIFKITGMAIFDRDKMVDVLDIDEAKGILWANDEIERALLVVEDEEIGLISGEIQKSKTKVSTQVENGIPSFSLEIRCSGRILEVIGKEGSLSKEEQQRAEALFEAKIVELTENAIRRCFTEDRCDVFRFCEQVKKAEPQYWQQIKNNWKELMPDCTINVSASCSLDKTSQQAIYGE